MQGRGSNAYYIFPLSSLKKKGYQSPFEHFSVNDEEILGKCCSEVSRSLQEIFSQRDRKQSATKPDEQSKIIVVSDGEGISPLKSKSIGQTRDEMSFEQSETDSISYLPEPKPRRDSSRRRSSVGQLAHFVKRNANSDKPEVCRHDSATDSKGIIEAVRQFQFRSQDPERLKHREEERRQSDPDFLVAQSKRKRMTDYGQTLIKE